MASQNINFRYVVATRALQTWQMRAHRIRLMNQQQAANREGNEMCTVNINRFLETARQYLLDEVAVSEPVHQVN
jgi:hypothetical protein